MDYRCPVCKANLAKRRLSQAVVVRMEIDCSHCKCTIRHNFHRAEVIIVLLSFGTFVVSASFAYLWQSQELMLFAFGAAVVGALALPLLEHGYLRTWPRFAATVQRPDKMQNVA